MRVFLRRYGLRAVTIRETIAAPRETLDHCCNDDGHRAGAISKIGADTFSEGSHSG
jgi:hypothetical protein